MLKHSPNPKVDFFFDKTTAWQAEYAALRDILLDCGLVETLKWGCPCYLFEGKNIVLIHGFKAYCALLFFKGALLNDPEKLLVQQTEHVQASRQVRFTDLEQVKARKKAIKALVFAAVAAEEAGLKVTLKKTEAYPVPEEFSNRLSTLPRLKAAFEALTPGRQRAYLMHFAAAKQAKTRLARIEKCMPAILEGKGLND